MKKLLVLFLVMGVASLQATVSSNQEKPNIKIEVDSTKAVKTPEDASMQMTPDGSVMQKNADGSKLIQKADGTSAEVKADGSKVVTTPDGTTLEGEN